MRSLMFVLQAYEEHGLAPALQKWANYVKSEGARKHALATESSMAACVAAACSHLTVTSDMPPAQQFAAQVSQSSSL